MLFLRQFKKYLIKLVRRHDFWFFYNSRRDIISLWYQIEIWLIIIEASKTPYIYALIPWIVKENQMKFARLSNQEFNMKKQVNWYFFYENTGYLIMSKWVETNTSNVCTLGWMKTFLLAFYRKFKEELDFDLSLSFRLMSLKE